MRRHSTSSFTCRSTYLPLKIFRIFTLTPTFGAELVYRSGLKYAYHELKEILNLLPNPGGVWLL